MVAQLPLVGGKTIMGILNFHVDFHLHVVTNFTHFCGF